MVIKIGDEIPTVCTKVEDMPTWGFKLNQNGLASDTPGDDENARGQLMLANQTEYISEFNSKGLTICDKDLFSIKNRILRIKFRKEDTTLQLNIAAIFNVFETRFIDIHYYCHVLENRHLFQEVLFDFDEMIPCNSGPIAAANSTIPGVCGVLVTARVTMNGTFLTVTLDGPPGPLTQTVPITIPLPGEPIIVQPTIRFTYGPFQCSGPPNPIIFQTAGITAGLEISEVGNP